MPHVIIKMYPGRTEQQKSELTDKIVKAVMEAANVDEYTISVSIEEIAKEKWATEVYEPDIIKKENTLYKKPGYKPL